MRAYFSGLAVNLSRTHSRWVNIACDQIDHQAADGRTLMKLPQGGEGSGVKSYT
jgi:hypothetical protein